MHYLRNQQSNQRSNTGDLTNRRQRALAWHSGDYPEIFLYLSATKYGFVWRAVEQGNLLERGIAILTKTEPQAAVEQQALTAARAWVKANIPGARIRVRSALERTALFGVDYTSIHNRRRAA